MVRGRTTPSYLSGAQEQGGARGGAEWPQGSRGTEGPSGKAVRELGPGQLRRPEAGGSGCRGLCVKTSVAQLKSISLFFFRGGGGG